MFKLQASRPGLGPVQFDPSWKASNIKQVQAMLNFFRTGGIFLQFLPTHFFAKTKLIWFPQILNISTTIESGLLPGSAVSEGSDEPLSGAPESDLALHTWPQDEVFRFSNILEIL